MSEGGGLAQTAKNRHCNVRVRSQPLIMLCDYNAILLIARELGILLLLPRSKPKTYVETNRIVYVGTFFFTHVMYMLLHCNYLIVPLSLSLVESGIVMRRW